MFGVGPLVSLSYTLRARAAREVLPGSGQERPGRMVRRARGVRAVTGPPLQNAVCASAGRPSSSLNQTYRGPVVGQHGAGALPALLLGSRRRALRTCRGTPGRGRQKKPGRPWPLALPSEAAASLYRYICPPFLPPAKAG